MEKNLKMMLVDDVQDIYSFMQSHFQRRGFTVFTAASAEEAPEIMLLDVSLPGASGLELLKSVREFNRTSRVIMVTGYDLNFQNEPRFKELGVSAVMRKPVTMDDLDVNIAMVMA